MCCKSPCCSFPQKSTTVSGVADCFWGEWALFMLENRWTRFHSRVSLLKTGSGLSLLKISTMAGLAVSDRMLDGYLGFLRRLDIAAKKQLIIRLTESIEAGDKPPADIGTLFGAWSDSRSSDEIIRDIREARTPNRDIDPL